jgi:predicted GNAT family acetyltransferase
MTNLIDNKTDSRYELLTDGHLSVADYRLEGSTLAITRVMVPEALRGRGIAAQVMDGVVADAAARGLQINPLCSYAASYMARKKL